MITAKLESGIAEFRVNPQYELVRIELGSEPMQELEESYLKTIQNIFESGVSMKALEVTRYKNIPIRQHPSNDKILFCVKLKDTNE